MDDGYELTLHGLLRKRAEMARDVEVLHTQLSVLICGMEHIDAAIRVFNPAIDVGDMPERPAPPASVAFRGEFQRTLLNTLRASGEPMTTFDLARAVIASRHLNADDRVLFKLISGRTGHALTRLRKAGLVGSERETKGALLTWTLAAKGASGEPVAEWRNGSG